MASTRPAVTNVSVYPASMDEILSHELPIQYLRYLRVARRETNRLIDDFIDGKITEYDFKEKYERLTSEYEKILQALILSVDFKNFIDELEHRIITLERVIKFICLHRNNLEKSTVQILSNIVKYNLRKVRVYRKAVLTISESVNEELEELTKIIESQKEWLRRRMNSGRLEYLKGLTSSYAKYKYAISELRAVEYSMNLGLTEIYDDLQKLMKKLEQLKLLETKLLIKDISLTEFSNKKEMIQSDLYSLRNKIEKSIQDFSQFKEMIYSNKEKLKEVLGKTNYKIFLNALNESQYYIKKINKILSDGNI